MMTNIFLLFLFGWLCGTISGVAGFGGALLLLPILSNFIDIKTVVPVLTIAQLLGNSSRAWFSRKNIKWLYVFLFISTAIPFSIIGSISFSELPKKFIFIGIGILLIVFVALRRCNITAINFGKKGLVLGGALTGFLSGIAGSAGPIGAAFFLGLNLPALSYISSEATTALMMHLTKVVVYQRYSLIGSNELLLGCVIGSGMMLGSFTGKNVIQVLPQAKFVAIVEGLLLLSGLQLIFME